MLNLSCLYLISQDGHKKINFGTSKEMLIWSVLTQAPKNGNDGVVINQRHGHGYNAVPMSNWYLYVQVRWKLRDLNCLQLVPQAVIRRVRWLLLAKVLSLELETSVSNYVGGWFAKELLVNLELFFKSSFPTLPHLPQPLRFRSPESSKRKKRRREAPQLWPDSASKPNSSWF